jgi:hypothetical protein
MCAWIPTPCAETIVDRRIAWRLRIYAIANAVIPSLRPLVGTGS